MTGATLARDVAEVEFVSPILGFDDERTFHLAALERSGVLWSLESARTDGLRFVMATPEAFFPDYHPEVDESALAPLAADEDDLVLLVILSVDGALAKATANLLAPVVLAPSTGRAMQVVLGDDTLSLRAPLQPAAAG